MNIFCTRMQADVTALSNATLEKFAFLPHLKQAKGQRTTVARVEANQMHGHAAFGTAELAVALSRGFVGSR
jgi:hypothetical protein